MTMSLHAGDYRYSYAKDRLLSCMLCTPVIMTVTMLCRLLPPMLQTQALMHTLSCAVSKHAQGLTGKWFSSLLRWQECLQL